MAIRVLRASEITGKGSLKHHRTALVYYLAWCEDVGYPLSSPDTMTYQIIDRYIRNGIPDLDSRKDYRWRLRSLAHHANPGPDAPRHEPVGYASVKPNYTDREMADIRFIALNQRTPRLRRQLCACVGLGRGAGLDASDIRDLYRRDVDDLGADGIRVNVHGKRPRTVWVRREWEDLVRVGIDGLTPGRLVLGRKKDRRNLVGKIVEQADLLGDAPHIEQNRLRATWLVDLMTDHVPIAVILQAAGLESARTITDLYGHLGRDDHDHQQDLRGQAS